MAEQIFTNTRKFIRGAASAPVREWTTAVVVMSAGGAAAADDDEVGLDKEGRMLVWCLDKVFNAVQTNSLLNLGLSHELNHCDHPPSIPIHVAGQWSSSQQAVDGCTPGYNS